MRGLVLLLGMTGLLSMALAQPMVGVIAFDWISFMSPQQDAWGSFGSGLPWAQLSVLATVIGCVVAKEPKRLPVNGMTILLCIFMVVCTTSAIYALGPPEIVNFWYLMAFKSFFFMLIVAALLTNERRVHALIWVMVISLGYYGIKGGLFTILTGGNNHVVGPTDSVLGDNNQMAVALLITLPLMNYLRLRSPYHIVRVGLVAAMVLTLFAIVGTYSRGALIALAAVTLFLWWNSKNKIITGIMLAIGLTLAIGFMPSQWVDRMTTISHYKKDDSAESRLTVWRQAIGIAVARPLTGAGFHGTAIPGVIHQFYPDATPRAVHSIWFEVLAETGFPGFFVWLAIQIVGIINVRRIRRLARGDPSKAWAYDLAHMAEVSIIAYLVGGSFLSLSYYDLYFTLLVILAATPAILQRMPVTAAAMAPEPIPNARRATPAIAWRLRREVR